MNSVNSKEHNVYKNRKQWLGWFTTNAADNLTVTEKKNQQLFYDDKENYLIMVWTKQKKNLSPNSN